MPFTPCIAAAGAAWLPFFLSMKSYSLREARRLAIGPNDWRQALWNKWLVGYLTPRDESEVHSSVQTKLTPIEPVQTESVEEEAAPVAPPIDDTLRPGGSRRAFDQFDALPLQASETSSDESAGRSRRVAAVRARLDQIVRKLDAVEMALDRQGERDGLARVQERVQQRTLSDVLDRLVEAQERQTQGVISCTRAIERLERRLVSLERVSRSSHSIVPDAALFEEAPFLGGDASDSFVPPSMTQRVRPTAAPLPKVDHVAPLSGKLSEISLPTLLSMAELEKWTGRLILEAGERTVLLDLEGGFLVGVFEDDSPSDAVETLYDLVEVRDGGFAFSPRHPVTKTERAPMTVGTLLLRASHRRDEVNRVEVGL